MNRFTRNCARAAVLMAAAVVLSACAQVYVDSDLGELRPEDRVAVANPQPIQLLFEFQTKGVTNGKATDVIKQTVVDAATASGLFSQVSNDPVPSGALLHITINNVPLDDDAYAKGFVTGFTFGLIGNTVGDGYIETIGYEAGTNAPMLTVTEHDAIYTSLGATAKTPVHAEKASDFKTAAITMSRRVVANGLNELAKKPEFKK